MRVLLADDDAASRRTLQHALGAWGYAATTVADGLQAWEHLSQGDEPTLAILDWMMPGLDGMELTARLRALPRVQPLYIIILTARNRTEDIVRGLAGGADDYVAKPYEMAELRARVDLAARTVRLQSQLVTLAYEDSLTGLCNRSRLMRVGADELVRSRRYQRPLSLVIMDVDHFKAINDLYGHTAGDQVLAQLGAAIKALVRHTDVPCRLGGDELVILAPETRLSAAAVLAGRVLNCARALEPTVNGEPIHVTLSLGVAELTAAEATIVDLIARADAALYHAKQAGRDRAAVADPTGQSLVA